MVNVIEDMVRSIAEAPGAVIGAAAVGVVGFVFYRLNKLLDRRADRKAADAARTPKASAANRRARQRFLNRMATRRVHRDGPARWFVTYEPNLAAYSLEHRGPGPVHDLRVDVFTRGRRPRPVGVTIPVPVLPAGVPLTFRPGAPSRARMYVLGLRWDDDFGVEQFERLPLSTAGTF
ncbi:hypothetical protein [Rathayibacter sp. AY1E8]|uniref:hypothetical protein n=1 Tax=Rathayibacter sp. AY1E8 TaxID=2080555 RepID=UPI0015E40934|nr:hypothetical protein [Rathayibacter sp. AY1E8]